MYSLVLMMALSNGAEAPTTFLDGCFGYTWNGCNGSCYGCYGCYGCHSRPRFFGWWHGCNGCNGCCGYVTCYGCNGAVAPQQGKGKNADEMPEDVDEPKEKAKEKKSSLEFAPATIVVTLPADAKLMIDGAVTASTSATRTFNSPPLKTGQEFYYNLKAVVVRDGETISASSRITVRGGKETRVVLELPQAVATR